MSDDNENEQPLNLDIPDHLEYSEEHAWVDRSVDPAIIGITEYAADQLGELVLVDLPEPGARGQRRSLRRRLAAEGRA